MVPIKLNSLRKIKKSLIALGYKVDIAKPKIHNDHILRFQKDYNNCSNKLVNIVKIKESGELNKETIKAIGIAINFSYKIADKRKTSPNKVWHNLCGKFHKKRKYADATSSENKHSHNGKEDEHCNYLEIMKNGVCKLRNTNDDSALRADVLDFEKRGGAMFAVVILPPQDGLESGSEEKIICPCILHK